MRYCTNIFYFMRLFRCVLVYFWQFGIKKSAFCAYFSIFSSKTMSFT